ncbi:MAG: hypothetical protein ACI934_001299 [Pseudohongiellaceae bacterium]|jgi:uncharacterized protein YbaP (TraB family)
MVLFSRLIFTCVLLIGSQTSLAQGPLLHEISFAGGKIILLGGTDVPEHNWLNGQVQEAIAVSDSLWLELPPEDADKGITPFREDIYPSVNMHPVAIEQGYGNLRFADYLDVTMGERSVVESQRLDLNGSWYQPMKPWVAYYYFAYNFWDKQEINLISPETELLSQFRSTNKAIHSLFPDRATFFRFLGAMSDTTQTQYFQSLYNIFDWQRSGEYTSRFEWVNGAPDTQFVDAHRQQTPLFYRYMYQQRNQAIAEQLLSVLEEGGNHFVYLELNRTLGPHSIQSILKSLGARVLTR